MPRYWDAEVFPDVRIRFRLKRDKLLSGEVRELMFPQSTPVIPPDVRCKKCGGQRLVRYGLRKQRQRYLCRDCDSVFLDNGALPRMRYQVEVVGDAVSLFYEGLSLNAICRQLRQTWKVFPADSNVYEWVVRFTTKATQAAKDLRAKVGDEWVADETVLKIGGENCWFWDVMDTRTRFLLSSHLTVSRFTDDAKTVMERAGRKAGKAPKVIITDRLRAYLDGIEKAFGADSEHVQSQGIRAEVNNNLIERFHGSLKARSKVMRGMQSRETAKLILEGWLVHYNFFRPHMALGNRTPGEAARVSFPFANWREVVVKETERN